MNCEYCHKPGHVWFQCPKKPNGWKPERLAKKRDSFPSSGCKPDDSEIEGSVSRGSNPRNPTKPNRKDTRKGDRHRPGYYRDYMRKYRAKLKAQKEMGE